MQTVATLRAYSCVQKKILEHLDSIRITPKKAYVMKGSKLGGLGVSGRTLRTISKGSQVSHNTITALLDKFGVEWVLTNGKIDIKNEDNKDSVTGSADGETVG